ncbi:MAG TPA: hypothetical protein VJL87_07825, partial [Bdellovibrionota bacterium]|nr:hypothetical protein [Bdellovibrionota bacterium]
ILSESPQYSDRIAFIKKIVRKNNETFDSAHNRIDVELEQVLVKIPDWGFFGSNEHAYVVAQIEAMEAHKVLYQAHLDQIKNAREYLMGKLLELLKKKEQPKEELTPEENR